MQFDITDALGTMFLTLFFIGGVGISLSLINLLSTCDDPRATQRDYRRAYIILIITSIVTAISGGLSAGFLGE